MEERLTFRRFLRDHPSLKRFLRWAWMAAVLAFLIIEYIMAYTRRIHHCRSAEAEDNQEDALGKVAVVTGASSGIGKATAHQFAKRGATVILACRNPAKASKTLAEIRQEVPEANLISVTLDLEDLDSVRSCAAQIASHVPHINYLICNAGRLSSDTLVRTKDGFERTLVTNYLGHFLLTNLMLELVKKGAPSRIVVLSSMSLFLADLDINDINLEQDPDLGFMDYRAYANSKLCNALFMRALSKKVEKHGVRVYGLCPGGVRTNLCDSLHTWAKKLCYGPWFWPYVGLTAEEGAEAVLYCALSKEFSKETGRMYRFRRHWASADSAINDEIARKLWLVSEGLVGLHPPVLT